MKKFEYKVLRYELPYPNDEYLDELGQAGWILASIAVRYDNTRDYYFVREILNNNNE